MLKNKLFYFIFLIYSGLLVILYNRIQTLHAFILFAGIFIIMFFFMLFMQNNIKVSISIDHQIAQVESGIPYTIIVENHSKFPISCICIETCVKNVKNRASEKEKIFVSIGGNARNEFSGCIKMKYAGVFQVVLSKAKIYDYLHIFSRRVNCETECKLTVIPRVREMQTELILAEGMDAEESQKYSNNKPGDDPSEVYGIREYQPGDKLQRIHWKLSNKSEALLVKEYSLPIKCSVAILIDRKMCEDELKVQNDLLEMMFSLSNHLLNEMVWHSLAWYQNDFDSIYVAEIKNREAFYEAMHDSLLNNYICEKSVIDYFYESVQNKVYENIFFITNQTDQKEIERLRGLFPQSKIQIINVCKQEDKINNCENEIYYNWVDAKQMEQAVSSLVLL
ncbi:hypothetical protein lbkm_3288 [Lachnospiraceae bacterium KM106-2]|nr:hypothetical protein lbkm_3288 [Lachnospiraceae bacterium KM106-2]